MAREPRTRAYVARRTAEGKTKTEIIRCLKRHIAREGYGSPDSKLISESQSPVIVRGAS